VGIPGLVDTVAHPDYVAADASRDRLDLANQAASLGPALDAADSIQAQDSLEKMLVHQMAVLHRGMMKAAVRMNEELDSAGVIDPNKREAGNVRACRLAGAISRNRRGPEQQPRCGRRIPMRRPWRGRVRDRVWKAFIALARGVVSTGELVRRCWPRKQRFDPVYYCRLALR
jgi:hypothetical protein